MSESTKGACRDVAKIVFCWEAGQSICPDSTTRIHCTPRWKGPRARANILWRMHVIARELPCNTTRYRSNPFISSWIENWKSWNCGGQECHFLVYSPEIIVWLWPWNLEVSPWFQFQFSRSEIRTHICFRNQHSVPGPKLEHRSISETVPGLILECGFGSLKCGNSIMK